MLVQATHLHGNPRPTGTIRPKRGFHIGNLGKFIIVDHREGQGKLGRRHFVAGEQIPLRTNGGVQRCDEFFTNRVQGRVGHLSELLNKVVKEEPWPLGEHRHRSIGPHGTERFGTRSGHGPQQDLQLFSGVAKCALAVQH